MPISYPEISDKIKQATRIATGTPHEPEAKLRELVAPLFAGYLKSRQLDLNLEQRDELVLANGTPDSVYNRLILEYKKPGVIKPDNAKNRVVIAKVRGYIEDLAEKEGWKKERLVGVAFDGYYFLFVRKVRRWVEQDPIPVTPESIEFFFQNLTRLVGGHPLIPEYLIRDFSVGDSPVSVAIKAIKAFYFALKENVNQKVTVFFDQWTLQFAEVHGAVENKKIDPETLFRTYGFRKDEQKDFKPLPFFFALDTYYALFMKLLAYQVVGHYTLGTMVELPLAEWERHDSATLKDHLKQVEDGGVFRQLGIRNFLEGDLLSWYLNDWNNSIEEAVREVIKRLNAYDPKTLELLPDETRDILKKVYQFLVPKQIRHDLGEYYTPDWLAERCLNQVGYGAKEKGLLEKRVLDPGCGSGTFLILAIKRAKEHGRLRNLEPAKTLTEVTKNIVGFDLNPLAVISARTNYLLAIADLLRYKRGEVTIPIYLCDSINPPQARVAGEMTLFPKKEPYEVKTAVGDFLFSHSIVTKQRIQQLADLLEGAVKKKLPSDEFQDKVRKELDLNEAEMRESSLYLVDTYERLCDLERNGINGIWSRIIKNAFAPYFVGSFDFVIGNPPWVNWESLPQEYRDKTVDTWQRYDLFEHTGLRARLGSAKDDISVLMTYVSIDKYLRDRGRLCIVITQTLFKTVGGGEGFRRFRLGKKGTPFRVRQVDDMSELQPFDSATNRTAVFFCQKGERTSYPVEYVIWRKKEKGSIAIDLDWEEVVQKTVVKRLKAQSIDGSEQGSWISARPKALKALKNVVGEAAYQAREGTNTGGANGVLWVEVKQSSTNLCTIENLNEIGKKVIALHRAEVETDLVFPLLRGRDIQRWNANPSIRILIPHDLNDPAKAIDTKIIESKFPKTLKFLEYFEKPLRDRALYKKYLEPQGVPFYGIYNIGLYTFAPYKVVWSEVGHDVEAAVVASHESDQVGKKVVVPDHTVVAISLEDEKEAHYVCAMLNSSPAQFIVVGYVVLHPSPHILRNIKIPKFNPNHDTHKELAHLSRQCHKKVAAGISVTDLEQQIDELAAELWGLSKPELKEIKESLEEMR
ncbi:MAG: SAM-dependent DNA methyltransferase [Ignavibacteria bacterium]|nr:SAM-dependent DNA methyltransferase [Ignavibacteria bacterium]